MYVKAYVIASAICHWNEIRQETHGYLPGDGILPRPPGKKAECIAQNGEDFTCVIQIIIGAATKKDKAVIVQIKKALGNRIFPYERPFELGQNVLGLDNKNMPLGRRVKRSRDELHAFLMQQAYGPGL
jgi:hypothetical protein